MCNRVVLPTIEISSTIISFRSFKESLYCVFLWSDIAGGQSRVSFGIASPVWTVVPSIFIAATPVGATNSTVGNSGLKGGCLNVFTAVWYIVLIK